MEKEKKVGGDRRLKIEEENKEKILGYQGGEERYINAHRYAEVSTPRAAVVFDHV